MNSNFFILLTLIVIGFFVFKIYRHFYPVTPPAAGTTQTTPINWDRVWNGIKFVAAVAGIFFLLSLAYAMLKNGGIGNGGDSTTQTVDVRDNYGVIQQNDIHVTNNFVQPSKKEVGRNKTTKQVVTQKGNTPKVSFRKYLDTNEDPPAISASMEKDAEIDPRKLLR